MKIRVKCKDCQLNIKLKAPFGKFIDKKKLENFTREELQGFFKPKKIKRTAVWFVGVIGIPLSEYLKNPIAQNDFFMLIEQIMITIKDVKYRGLSIDDLILELPFIYINKITKEIQLIYFPLKGHNYKNSISNVINSIVYAMSSLDLDNAEYLSHFIFYIRGLKTVDIQQIEDYVMKEDMNVIKLLYGEKKPASIQGKRDFEDEDEVTYIEDENDETILEDDVTMIENDELFFQHEKEYYPTLNRISTGEVVKINSSVFRLGKEKSCVDYAIKGNNMISRSHLDIICRKGHYFVFDLGSKNKSYINNRVLPQQQEIEIVDGDILKLANEEFRFKNMV